MGILDQQVRHPTHGRTATSLEEQRSRVRLVCGVVHECETVAGHEGGRGPFG
ncbi:MAG: hypothetical protein QG661_3053, partial [Actinomycetota bacterium]|nr:hypothetical protein [Actinomycetota bacterium]